MLSVNFFRFVIVAMLVYGFYAILRIMTTSIRLYTNDGPGALTPANVFNKAFPGFLNKMLVVLFLVANTLFATSVLRLEPTSASKTFDKPQNRFDAEVELPPKVVIEQQPFDKRFQEEMEALKKSSKEQLERFEREIEKEEKQ